jgi:outer membrane protein OmpA-like peptidoglycan-associated protein
MEKIKILLICAIGIILNTAVGQNKKAQDCYVQAFKSYNIGDNDKALSLLNKAIKKDPNFAKPYNLLAAIYERDKQIDKAVEAYENYIRIDSTYQSTYYYYAKMLLDNGREKEAERIANKFFTVPNMRTFNAKKDGASQAIQGKMSNLQTAIKMSKDESQTENEVGLKNLGPNVNTEAYEYWPGMTMDKKLFIFTRLKLSDKQEDFYYSDIRDGLVQQSRALPGGINTNDNEGTVAVHPNGSIIYYTVCNQPDGLGGCDLYYSTVNGANWSPRENMGNVVNSSSWDGQPTISMGGNTMIFCSSRPGGYGGKDLYITFKGDKGDWSKPKNLGPTINTKGSEEAPFLHYDGETLYFSSDGHDGLGGLDIFMSRLNELGEWSTPKNIGKYINSSNDEAGLYVEPEGKVAYFASDRPGGYGGLDIYTFNLSEELKPAPANIITISLIDKATKKPVIGKMILTNLRNSRIILDTTLSRAVTYYPSGGNYGLFAQASGYLPFSQNYSKALNEASGLNENIIIELIAATKGNSIVLENIFFDFDKWDLKPESQDALANLLKYLRNNSKINVEIGGYTDNKGSQEYNKTLSDKRARSVYDYLVKNGISASRLTSKGYGSLPTDDNSTEEKQAVNRRIELKIN